MSESKVFKLPESMSVEQVGRGIESFLRDRKKLITEGTITPDGYFVQAKGEDGWKKIAGLDLATQVQIVQVQSMITVEVGSGKWSDKDVYKRQVYRNCAAKFPGRFYCISSNPL